MALSLGYSSYSDYILEIRMAKDPVNVQNFEEELTLKLLKKGKEEYDLLQDLKRKETGDSNAILESWDRSYYNNLLKEQQYQVDEEKIKEYFPTNHVVKVTMEIYQELLNLKFTQLDNPQVWHEDVTCYKV